MRSLFISLLPLGFLFSAGVAAQPARPASAPTVPPAPPSVSTPARVAVPNLGGAPSPSPPSTVPAAATAPGGATAPAKPAGTAPVAPPPQAGAPATSAAPATPSGPPTPPATTAAAQPTTVGSVSGDVRLGDGRSARRAAIFLEGLGNPAGPNRERAVLSLRSAHRQLELLVVTAGQSLQITNDDLMAHSIFSVSPTKPLALGSLAASESRTLVLDKPGVIELFCHLHDAMEAVVVVAPNGLWALTTPAGSFTIAGVPSGRYRAVAYAPELGQVALPIEVRSGERSTLQFQVFPPSQPTVTQAKGKR